MASALRYAEYLNPRLVALYDTFNALGKDGEFFCRLAHDLSPATVIDFGCGTGLLTCELARRGYHVVGLDPSDVMLDVARRKPGGESVRWISGTYDRLEGLQADLVLMTSHVAQLFLQDTEWESMLRSVHRALRPGGYLVFDSRNPLTRAWEAWEQPASTQIRDTATEGKTELWYQLLAAEGETVRYEIHYRFLESGEELVSVNELIFRSREGIEEALLKAGFSVRRVYGDWDRSLFTATSPEMVFVSTRR